VPATGTRVPVYDGEDEEDALERAIEAQPELRARAERIAQRRASGERGIPAEQVYAELGIGSASSPPAGRGKRPEGQFNGKFLVHVPASVHRQLAERAKAEGTTLNQLVLSYVSRGLGLDGIEA